MLTKQRPFGLKDGRFDPREPLLGPGFDENSDLAVDQFEAFKRRIVTAEYRRLDFVQAKDGKVCNDSMW